MADTLDEGFRQFAEQVRQAALSALRDVGETVRQSMQERLSTAYPPASVPGEDPHSRTGALLAGVMFEIIEQGDLVILQVSSQRNGSDRVPGILRWMNRPYLQHTFEEWEERFPREFMDAFRNHFPGKS